MGRSWPASRRAASWTAASSVAISASGAAPGSVTAMAARSGRYRQAPAASGRSGVAATTARRRVSADGISIEFVMRRCGGVGGPASGVVGWRRVRLASVSFHSPASRPACSRRQMHQPCAPPLAQSDSTSLPAANRIRSHRTSSAPGAAGTGGSPRSRPAASSRAPAKDCVIARITIPGEKGAVAPKTSTSRSVGGAGSAGASVPVGAPSGRHARTALRVAGSNSSRASR